ncbi:MAG: hypothetical protein NTV34_10455 [Proteobacteria bacterium]|nr:hypothetical protein [Pseudomonadota bacterium]
MIYKEFLTEYFFSTVSTLPAVFTVPTVSTDAVDTLGSMNFKGGDFSCSICQGSKNQQYKYNLEVCKCVAWGKRNRLRTGTSREHSKTILLKWLRAIYFAMQVMRGVSGLKLMGHLAMKSCGTIWSMLLRNREALRQRDETYRLKWQISLDGAVFGRRDAKFILIAFAALAILTFSGSAVAEKNLLSVQEAKDFCVKVWFPRLRLGHPVSDSELKSFVQKLLNLYDENITMVDPNSQTMIAKDSFKGKAEVANFYETILKLYPVWKFNILEIYPNPKGFVLRYEGLDAGPVKRFEGVDILELKKSAAKWQITKLMAYYDRYPFLSKP